MPESDTGLAATSGWVARNRLFTEWRLGLSATLVALACALITIALWPTFHSGRAGQHCLDFNWIWLTGKLAAANAAAQVYNPSAPLPPEVAALPQFQCGGTVGDGRFDYPPTIFFFTYPLGFMPYFTALAAWLAATLLLYLAAVYAILPRVSAVIASLTTYPVALNILIGHNGFLTAGLFGLALAFMERRPWLSGVFLGLLTYKPQLGVLFPLALLASRNWRAFISASVTSVAFAAAAAIAFGYSLWPSFFMGMSEEATRLSDGKTVSPIIFPTIRGVLQHMDFGTHTSWATQAIVSGCVIIIICVLWFRPLPYSLKAAALAAASLLTAPYALSYDYCILSIAAAFLVRDGLERGFLRGERPIILVCWGGFSLFAFVAAISLTASTGHAGPGEGLLYVYLAVIPLIITTALFSLVLWRAKIIEANGRGPVVGSSTARLQQL